MPSIFGGHMVFQHDTKLPVWGCAGPGEDVTVVLGETTAATMAATTANAKGDWRVALPLVKTAGKPQTLTVREANKLKFDDVLVGNVWACSGQSNMRWNLKYAHDAATELPKADDPQLRLFFVDQTTALEPQRDVKGRWVVSTPASAGNFSEVGYFFGKEMRAHLQRPVRLIGTYWGSTKAEWLAKDALPASSTDLQGFVIAGGGRQWKPAKAKIGGDKVIVTSAEVPKPVAMRYAFENNPACNFYNKGHLPAAPFRTDDWPSHQQKKP